ADFGDNAFELAQQSEAARFQRLLALAFFDLLLGGGAHFDDADLVLPGRTGFTTQRRDFDEVGNFFSDCEGNIFRAVRSVWRVVICAFLSAWTLNTNDDVDAALF